MLTVRSIMSADPVAVGAETTIREAANIMLERGIGGLPVLDENGSPLGVISASDFLKRGELRSQDRGGFWHRVFSSRGELAEEYAKAHGKLASEVMTAPAVTVEPDATIDAAAGRMADRDVRRLLVVENGRLVGIVTRTDIMRALIREVVIGPTARADADIRQALESELERHRWGDAITFHVNNTVVTLEGRVLDPREKTALRVAAENTIGVSQVIDRVMVVKMPTMPVAPPGF